jgi:hypothetical protein
MLTERSLELKSWVVGYSLGNLWYKLGSWDLFPGLEVKVLLVGKLSSLEISFTGALNNDILRHVLFSEL